MTTPLFRWRLRLAWFGDAYVGWQRQPNGLSVQEVVEDAVSGFFGGVPVIARAAGRLDAGVHSRGQVVVVDVPVQRSSRAWVRALATIFPDDITCLAAEPCAPDFEPRRDAVGKHYRYRWLERWPHCPFRANRTWHIRRRLDVPAMDAAAQVLQGTHDYSAFRAAGCTASSPVRAIRHIAVRRVADEVHLDVRGPAFLRHQVRIIAGTLTQVGVGRFDADRVAAILASGCRRQAGLTAPAWGLWLEEVLFEPPLHWDETAGDA